MILNAIFLVLVLCSIILAFLALIKNNFFIKLLLVNVSTSLMSCAICVLSSFHGNSSYIDIAIIYYLVGSISSIAYLKYFVK